MAEVLENAARLSQVIGARPGGTEEEQQASFFIEETMQKAGLATSVEEFNCNPNYELPRFICCVVSVVLGTLAIFLPLMVIPALIVTIVTAIMYALEVLGISPLSNTAKRGISQNVVAKYFPGTALGADDELLEAGADNASIIDGSSSDDAMAKGKSRRSGAGRGAGARKRKIILIARYDSGRVCRELQPPFFSILPIIHWIEIGGMALIPVALLVKMLVGVESPAAIVFDILIAIGVLAALIPIIIYILHQTAPYSDGANNNASGVAVMTEVAKRIAASKAEALDVAILQSPEQFELGASEADQALRQAEAAAAAAVADANQQNIVTDAKGLVVMHGEDALRNEHVLPVDTDLVYEEAARGRIDPSSLEAQKEQAAELVAEGIAPGVPGAAVGAAAVEAVAATAGAVAAATAAEEVEAASELMSESLVGGFTGGTPAITPDQLSAASTGAMTTAAQDTATASSVVSPWSPEALSGGAAGAAGAGATGALQQSNVEEKLSSKYGSDVPDWFKKGIKKAAARKDITQPDDRAKIGRSKLSDALDAAHGLTETAPQTSRPHVGVDAVFGDGPNVSSGATTEGAASATTIAPAATDDVAVAATAAPAATTNTTAAAEAAEAATDAATAQAQIAATPATVAGAAEDLATAAQANGVQHEIDAAAAEHIAAEAAAQAQASAAEAQALGEEAVAAAAVGDEATAVAAGAAQEAAVAQAVAQTEIQNAAQAAEKVAEEAAVADRTISYIPVAANIPTDTASEIEVADVNIADSVGKSASDILEEATAKTTEAETATMGGRARVAARKKRELSLPSLTGALGKVVSAQQDAPLAEDADREAGEKRTALKRKHQEQQNRLKTMLPFTDSAPLDKLAAQDQDDADAGASASAAPATDISAAAAAAISASDTAGLAPVDPAQLRTLVNPKDEQAQTRSTIAVAAEMETTSQHFVDSVQKDAEAALNSLNFDDLGEEAEAIKRNAQKREAAEAARGDQRNQATEQPRAAQRERERGARKGQPTKRSRSAKRGAPAEAAGRADGRAGAGGRAPGAADSGATAAARNDSGAGALTQAQAQAQTQAQVRAAQIRPSRPSRMDSEDIIIEDVDDSYYTENRTQTGAMAGPGYVEMPKSRASRFKSMFSRKKKTEETSFSEAMGLGSDFDARKVGAERGGWESFQNNSAGYDASKVDRDEIVHEESSEDRAYRSHVDSYSTNSRRLRHQEDSADLDVWDSSGDWDNDEWNGGAFSMLRKFQADNENAEVYSEEGEYGYDEYDEYADFDEEVIDDGHAGRRGRGAGASSSRRERGGAGSRRGSRDDGSERSARSSRGSRTSSRSSREGSDRSERGDRSDRASARSSERGSRAGRGGAGRGGAKAAGPFDMIAGKLSSLTGTKDEQTSQRRHTPADPMMDAAADGGDIVTDIAAEDMIAEREEIRHFKSASPAGGSFAEVAALAAGTGAPGVTGFEEVVVVNETDDPLVAPTAFPTEVWFVALGAELTDNAGIKNFLAEHDHELSGAVIIELEAMGAGTLAQVDDEGSIKHKKTPSRMKRFVTKAGAALGLHINGVKMNWRDSASYFAAEKGLQTIHLAGYKDGKPKYLGEKDDIVENLSEEQMMQNVAFLLELMRTI